MNYDTQLRDPPLRAKAVAKYPTGTNKAAAIPQSAAIRGAALAFTARPVVARSSNSYSGTNGATAAAAVAGGGTRPTLRPAYSQKAEPLPSAPRGRPTPVQERVKQLEEEVGVSSLEIPSGQLNSQRPVQSRSPSQVAAQLANAMSVRQEPSKPTRPPSKPKISSTNIVTRAGPTESSVRSSTKMNLEPSVTASRPLIASPKPIRPLSSKNLAIANVLAVEQSPPARPKNILPAGLDATQREVPAGDAVKAAAKTTTTVKIPANPAKRRSARSQTAPMEPFFDRGRSPPQISTQPISIRYGRRRSEEVINSVQQSASVNSAVTDSTISPSQDSFVSFPDSSEASLPGLTPGSMKSSSRPDLTAHRTSSQTYFLAPLKDPRTGMTEHTLADAIVASSLASSRAGSPAKYQAPPPPPRHRSKSRTFFLPLHHHHHHKDPTVFDEDYARTPSPGKAVATHGMRHTLRAHPKSDDEADQSARRGRRHIIRKHPNKHHEGDRKRWRDEITDREKRRYEGVWAANRALYLPLLSSAKLAVSPQSPAEETSRSLSENPQVLNLVVRDIWSRSRLPASDLEEVWNLVDRTATGTLERDEFVVGMWLIDQKLKGRKLPFRVSDSVWGSARFGSGNGRIKGR